MTTGDSPTRSIARAQLSQLIEMFGVDGCLRIGTLHETDTTGWAPGFAIDSGELEGGERS
ncbi:hypothetical protein ACIHAA_04050 [Streptomyces sp. NPDC052040]|uniref:hypothetical protein n=1 Tax=unclassified Streptomyces TaxID=2593676 RepID=UPI0037CFFE67